MAKRAPRERDPKLDSAVSRIPERPKKRGETRVEIGSYKLTLRPGTCRTTYGAYNRTAGTCIARDAVSSDDAWLVFDARGMILGTLEESTGDEPWVCQRVQRDNGIPRRWVEPQATRADRPWFELQASCRSGVRWVDALEAAFCRIDGIISENIRIVVK